MSKKNKIMGEPTDVTELVRRWGLQKIELQACRTELHDSTLALKDTARSLHQVLAVNADLRKENTGLRVENAELIKDAALLRHGNRDLTILAHQTSVDNRLQEALNAAQAKALASADRWGTTWLVVAVLFLIAITAFWMVKG